MGARRQTGAAVAVAAACAFTALHCTAAATNPPCDGASTNEGPSDATAVSVRANEGGPDALAESGIGPCPKIAGIVATPYVVDVDASALVKADLTSTDAGAVASHWAAPSGSFAEPSATETTFVCGTPGPVLLTFTLTQCSVSATVPIQCRSSTH